MADCLQRGSGLLRQVDAALRTAGGSAVLLRMPQPAATGDDAEQLGLATPGFSDVEIAPAVFREAGNESTLVVSASAVESVTGTLAFDSADVLFATAVGVVVNGVVFDLVRWTTAHANGSAYAYYLGLQRTGV
jgi:hypothetical protein